MDKYINQIINADCLDILRELPDKCIDLVLTDPPFLYVSGGCKGRYINKKITKELGNFGEDKIYIFLCLISKKLKKMNAYVFASRLQIPYYLNWCIENKYKFDILIWNKDKIDIKTTKTFANDIEYIIRIYENKVNLNKIIVDEKVSCLYYTKLNTFKQPNNIAHVTPKPVELFKNYIILSSNKNDLILDPFSGSGTTAVACHNLNRRFICIEKDYDYWKASVERLKEAQSQLKLF